MDSGQALLGWAVQVGDEGRLIMISCQPRSWFGTSRGSPHVSVRAATLQFSSCRVWSSSAQVSGVLKPPRRLSWRAVRAYGLLSGRLELAIRVGWRRQGWSKGGCWSRVFRRRWWRRRLLLHRLQEGARHWRLALLPRGGEAAARASSAWMRAMKAREASNSTSGTGEPANHSTGCLQAGHFESPVENHLSPHAMWMWWRHGIVAVETACCGANCGVVCPELFFGQCSAVGGQHSQVQQHRFHSTPRHPT